MVGIYYHLCDYKGGDEKKTRALGERKAPGSSHEDQGLTDGADLKINSRSHHFVERIRL